MWSKWLNCVLVCLYIGLGVCAAAPNPSATDAPAGPAASAAAPSRQEIIDALIRRSRLLGDARFAIPHSLYARYVRATHGPGEPAPPPVGVIAERGRYAITADAEAPDAAVELSVRLRVRVLDPGAGRDLAVLTEALRWREVAVNGEASDLGADEGWYRFTPPEAGVYEITARAALVDCGPQRGRAEWAIPRTVRTLVTVR
ncbi:MAG: hypothetical protein KGY99_11500, partial [Phycisphaerae bacterium]|nr:hypothetical protein [Phycisphaerae bacterium]